MDHNRQTWSQSAEFSGIIFKPDANRHALHYLGEVTGRILWRNHAELRACGGRKTRNAPMKADAGQYIGNDLDRLVLAHARQLAFLKIGVNP
jgi:hypothetical protein